MSVHIQAGAEATTIPFVLYENLFVMGGPLVPASASSSAPGSHPANVLGPQTFDYWQPTSLPAWLRVAGIPAPLRTCDTLAIAAHTLGSSGCAARVARNAANRSNLIPWSQDFTKWATSGSVTVDSTNLLAPDGSYTAAQVTATTASNRTFSLNVPLPAPSATADYYFSMYVNRELSSTPVVGLSLLYSGSGEPVVTFNLDTGAIDNALYPGGAFMQKLSDGWYRIGYRVQWDTGSPVSTMASVRLRLTAGATHVIWGAQLEDRTLQSSYIPTNGSAVTSEWYAVTDFILPKEDSTLIALFPTSSADNSFRIEITGPTGAQPVLGIVYLGEKLPIPLGVLADHVPVTYAKSVELLNNTTLQGQLKQNRVKRRGAATTVALAKQERWWIQQEWQPFVDHYLDGKPFFWASAPDILPEDAAYCWRDGEMDISFGQGAMYGDISFGVDAFVR